MAHTRTVLTPWLEPEIGLDAPAFVTVAVSAARPPGVVSLVFGLILFLAGLTGRADALP